MAAAFFCANPVDTRSSASNRIVDTLLGFTRPFSLRHGMKSIFLCRDESISFQRRTKAIGRTLCFRIRGNQDAVRALTRGCDLNHTGLCETRSGTGSCAPGIRVGVTTITGQGAERAEGKRGTFRTKNGAVFRPPRPEGPHAIRRAGGATPRTDSVVRGFRRWRGNRVERHRPR